MIENADQYVRSAGIVKEIAKMFVKTRVGNAQEKNVNPNLFAKIATNAKKMHGRNMNRKNVIKSVMNVRIVMNVKTAKPV